MESDDIMECPVSECTYEGTLSNVIHHVTDQGDEQHTWNSLGYQHSGEFRASQEGSSPQADIEADENTTAEGKPEHEDSSGITEQFAEGTFPEEMKNTDQWLLWKEEDDGRKIPRAPWEKGDPLRFVNGLDPLNWVSFDEALEWQSKLPNNFNLAYAITRDDEIAFLDLDDVIINGELSPEARTIIKQADSYTAISTSGTGIHIFIRGSLSDDVQSLTGAIDEGANQSLEVYDRNRFVAMTGNHLNWTPTEITTGDPLLSKLTNEYASVSSGTPDRATAEPQRTRDELREIETTNEIQDIFDAISQTRPSDIRMRSTQTREHGDGTFSYDPSWVYSESGTRLGVLEDVWIYRKGMIALDALQLVALEERIITDEREYPKGADFWDAVDALRSRGAHIPRFEPDDEPITETSVTDHDTDIDKWEVAKRINYGQRVRTYVHPYDRDYQEELALELTPILIEAVDLLHLSAAVAYRAGELYAKGHAAGVVPGAAHESSLGAALRIASIEADTPRPLADIAEVVDEDAKSVRKKFHQIVQETDLSETMDASDLIVGPSDYVSYTARQLGVADDTALRESVNNLLRRVEHDGASNPISEVAAAFYVAMKQSDEYSITQEDIACAVGLTEVTIRNNYRKYTKDQ